MGINLMAKEAQTFCGPFVIFRSIKWAGPHLMVVLLAGRILLLRRGDLRLFGLLGLLLLLLQLDLLGEASDQLRLQALGAQRATLQLLTQVVHLHASRGIQELQTQPSLDGHAR